MLTVENLHVRYEKNVEILKGLSLEMASGCIHGMVGLNGAGKTTLLNTLYGFVPKQKGEIRWNGNPLKRKDLSYLEAENYFYPNMTGKEYLQLFSSGYAEFDMSSWQELFSLPLDDVTESYSTGMRKKLALLAVLKQDKPVMILDEPFNGLDLESVFVLTRIISLLKSKGKTVLITSHIYETLTGCCDWIHYLTAGIIEKSYGKDQFDLLQEELWRVVEKRAGELLNRLT